MATQDMPPPGGFASINVERTFAKPFLKQKYWFLVGIASLFYMPYAIREHKKKLRVLKIEQAEHYIAASPFLVAEQERKFLKYLRHIRDQERELMKDHPGWQVGTLYGEKIFKTLPKGALPPVAPADYISHTPEWIWFRHYVLPDQHQ